MAVLILCPNKSCHKKMRVSADLRSGAKVRCPVCRTVFVAPSAEPETLSLVVESESDDPPVNEAETIDQETAPPASGPDTLSYSDEEPHKGRWKEAVTNRRHVTVNTPDKIARFEVRRVLGEGAFGKVYEAYDPQLDRAVALKVAKLDRGDSGQRIKRFLREAKAAANLRHPNIVPLYEFGQDGEAFYIASAFIQGRTLADALREKETRKMAPARAARITQRLADALAYAHGQGIVHRDVKPANVMLDDKDEPMLMDFGLASRQDEAEKLTHAGTVLGTPLYMAPEQAQGKGAQANPASDQYSLGVMLFEMIVGRPPFEGKPELVMFHHVETEPPSPRSLNSRISRDLETISLKCLEKKPAQRFRDARALAEDLRRYVDGEPIRARKIGRIERFSRWCKRNPAVAGLGLTVVLTLIIGISVSSWLAMEANAARDQANESALQARQEATRASTNEALAKEKSILAQANAVLAQNQAARAEKNGKEAVEQAAIAKTNALKAQQEAENARRQSTRAQRVSGFLVGLFDAVDPLGMTGFKFGPDPKQGSLLTAREVLERGLRKVKTELKDDPEMRATVLMTIGSVLRNLGQYKEARPLLEEALEIHKKAKSKDSDLAESWYHLGWLNQHAGEDFDALHCFREALRLVDGKPGHEELQNRCRFNMAWVLAELDYNIQAEQLFRQVLAERRQRLGDQHFEVAVARMGLAACLLQTPKKVEAMPLASAALNTFRTAYGDESMAAAAGLFQGGIVDAMLNNLDGAETKLLEASEIGRKRLGDNHPFVAWSLMFLADSLGSRAQGIKSPRGVKALDYYQRAIRVVRDGAGLDHRLALKGVDNMASWLGKQGDYPGGCKLYEEAIQTIRAKRDANHPLLALALGYYGIYAYHHRKLDVAEKLLAEAVAVDRQATRGHYGVVQYGVRNILGIIYSRTRVRSVEAERLFREMLEAHAADRDSPQADMNVTVAVTWMNLSIELLHQKKHAELPELLKAYEALTLQLKKDTGNTSKVSAQAVDHFRDMKRYLPTLLLEDGRLSASLLAQFTPLSPAAPLEALASRQLQTFNALPPFEVVQTDSTTVIQEDRDALTTTSPRDSAFKQSYCKVYPLTLEAGARYQIDMQSNVVDAYLRLETLDGRVLAKDDDSGGNLNARLVITANQRISCRCVATTFVNQQVGSFVFTVRRLEASTLALLPRTPVARIQGAFAPADVRKDSAGQRRSRAYDLVLEEGYLYQLDLCSDAFQSLLRLESDLGALLEQRSHGGVGSGARIYFRPAKTRLVRAVVLSFDADAHGSFLLAVDKIHAVPPHIKLKQPLLPASASTTPQASFWASEAGVNVVRTGAGRTDNLLARPHQAAIQLDGTIIPWGQAMSDEKQAQPEKRLNIVINGALTADDPRDRVQTRSPHRVHSFKLSAGKTYTIDLISKEFDAYLRLENAARFQLAFDDDSGGDLNARLVYTPSATGDYRIIATSFDENLGAYVLKIREADSERTVAGVAGKLPRRQSDGSLHWSWQAGKVKITQFAKALPDTFGVTQSYLIGYRIENLDTVAHSVGVRAALQPPQTFFATDKEGVIASPMDWKQGNVPTSLRFLENADLKNPGLTSWLTSRPGGNLEPADRVLLTRFSGPPSATSWAVESEPFAEDPAVWLFWEPRMIAPGETRLVGFALGMRAADLKAAPIEIKPPANNARLAQPIRGLWRIENANLVQKSAAKQLDGLILFGDPDWTDYDLEVECQGSPYDFAVCFRSVPDRLLFLTLGGWGNTKHGIIKRADGEEKALHEVNASVKVGQSYKVRIEARGQQFKVLLDGQMLFQERIEGFDQGGIGFRTYGCSARYRNIRVTAPDGKVLFEGLPELESP